MQERHMKHLLILAAAAIFVLFFLLFVGHASSGDSVYPSAPGFVLEDLEGNTHTLDEYKGKVIFLNFWATWCPPCRQEIPGFLELYEQYKDEGMVILGISLDQQGEAAVKSFAGKMDITYPLIMASRDIMEKYQPGQYIPATIVIDKEGRVRDRHVGYFPKTDMEKMFLQLND
jgi:peroxiredoxin